jgi:hypothetical protein
MGCVLALFAWISPRFVLALLYLFTTRLTVAFSSGWAGLLGFIVVPYTTLFYALVYQAGLGPHHGVSGFGWVIVGLGALLDLSSLGFGRRAQSLRSRTQSR